MSMEDKLPTPLQCKKLSLRRSYPAVTTGAKDTCMFQIFGDQGLGGQFPEIWEDGARPLRCMCVTSSLIGRISR